MCTHYDTVHVMTSPGLYVPSTITNTVCVSSYPFALKQYPFEKKREEISIDTTFESSELFLVKELSQPSCLEPYSIWQNLVPFCRLKNVQMTLLDDRLNVTLKTVFLLPADIVTVIL